MPRKPSVVLELCFPLVSVEVFSLLFGRLNRCCFRTNDSSLQAALSLRYVGVRDASAVATIYFLVCAGVTRFCFVVAMFLLANPFVFVVSCSFLFWFFVLAVVFFCFLFRACDFLGRRVVALAPSTLRVRIFSDEVWGAGQALRSRHHSSSYC